MTWYHVVVFVHVFSAALWVGGIFFLSLVAVPAARSFDDANRARIFTILGRRFRRLGWTLLLLLWVTGAIQAVVRGATLENVLSGAFFATRFGRLLAYKLGLVLLMMLVSFLHDFVIGPRSSAAIIAGGDATVWRRRAAWLGRLTAALVVGIVLLAVMLPR